MRALWLTLASALAACSLPLEPGGVENLCSGDSECVGSVCDLERGICVADTVVPLEIALQVIPSSDTPDERPNFLTAPFEVTGSATRDLQIESWVQVAGQVRIGAVRVPAELTFSRPGLPGQPDIRIRASTFNEPLIEGDVESDYSVRLEPGRAYDVEILPRADAVSGADTPWLRVLPPLYVEGQLETPPAEDGAMSIGWRASFPFPDSLGMECSSDIRAGCTIHGSVVSMDSEVPVAESGLQVRAVDGSGRTVSSTALTDDDGVFALALSPGARDYVFRVTGGMDRTLFPIVEADPAFLTEDFRIRVPRARVIRYVGRVEGPLDRPATTTTLAFSSSDIANEDGLVGTFRRTVTADADGEFDVELLEGAYEVVVTPSDIDLAVLTESVRITAPADGDTLQGQLFTVARRARLGGRVTSPDMREMAGVAVEAVAAPTPPSTLAREAQHNRSSEALTFETGQFDLPLDVGAYDLFLRPPAGTGFAWVVAPEFLVGNVDGTLMARYQMDAPVPLGGNVLGANGAPLPGGEVRAFAAVGERFIEVARARVDETGHYELLLPPSLVTP